MEHSASRAVILAALGVLGTATTAFGQLRPDEVLVIYDSRVADSRDVAEYYAGSSKVPGGAGNLPGKRKGVRVLNLASTGAAITSPGWASYSEYQTKIRNPIRTYLTANGLDRKVRCLVMTKGLPHRMDDSDNIDIGDNPGGFIDEVNAADATCASVDSQLTLLWQDLNTGEAGNGNDSKDDGCILNPYWKSASPIASFTTANIHTTKTFTVASVGPVWTYISAVGAAKLTPGDMMLVTRLDGRTQADVRAMIDRGQTILYNVNTDHIILDEGDSNGAADAGANSELDNQAALAPLRANDDYETTRDYLLNTDKRFAPSVVHYDPSPNAANFFIGTRVAYNGGIQISGNVCLLATAGSNHAGTFPTRVSDGFSGATVFSQSYFYANGAIFNTIESYNGRDFGDQGIGGIVQEQASDFIASGGTLAIGHVWEPLADTIADNEFLVKNFLEGNLSWAEAAWTSIPCLSWMHVVIGDPLARPARSSEDVDGSGRVGVGDLYAWEAAPTNIDRTGAADSADRLVLLRTLRFYERTDLMNRRP